MNKLNNSTVYLCGAVEAHDSPESWRNKITPILKTIGIEIWDPLVKPKWMTNISIEQQRSFKEIMKNPKLSTNAKETTWHLNNEIRRFCLHMVANCDFVIVKLCKTFTVGTFEELNVAKYKPILIISDDPIPSTWLISQLGIDHKHIEDYIFQNIDTVIEHLTKINNNTKQVDDKMKWMFMTYCEEKH